MQNILSASTEAGSAVGHLSFTLRISDLAAQIGLSALFISKCSTMAVRPCRIYILHIREYTEERRDHQL